MESLGSLCSMRASTIAALMRKSPGRAMNAGAIGFSLGGAPIHVSFASSSLLWKTPDEIALEASDALMTRIAMRSRSELANRCHLYMSPS